MWRFKKICLSLIVVASASLASNQSVAFQPGPPGPPVAPVELEIPICAQNFIGDSNGVFYYETAVLYSSMICSAPFGTGYSSVYYSPVTCGPTCNEVTPTVFKGDAATSRNLLTITNKPTAIKALNTLSSQLEHMLLSGNETYLSDEASIECTDADNNTLMKSRREIAGDLNAYIVAWRDALNANVATYREFKAQFVVYYPRFWKHFGVIQNGGDGTEALPRRIALDLQSQRQANPRIVRWQPNGTPNGRGRGNFHAKVMIDGQPKFFFVSIGEGTRRATDRSSTLIAQQIINPGLPGRYVDSFELVDRYSYSHVIKHVSGTNSPGWLNNQKIIVSTYEDLGFGLFNVECK